MPGIRPHRGIAHLQSPPEILSAIDDRTHETAATTHHEFAVPVIGKQQLEVNLGTDHARHFTMWHRLGLYRRQSTSLTSGSSRKESMLHVALGAEASS